MLKASVSVVTSCNMYLFLRLREARCCFCRTIGITRPSVGRFQTAHRVIIFPALALRRGLFFVVAAWMLCRRYIIRAKACMLICHFSGGFSRPREVCDDTSVLSGKRKKHNIIPIILLECIAVRERGNKKNMIHSSLNKPLHVLAQCLPIKLIGSLFAMQTVQ